MKKLALTSIAVAAGLAVSAAHAAWWSGKPTMETQMDKVSYTIGYDMGHSFKASQIAIKPSLVKAGIADALAGKKPQLSPSEMKTVMAAFQKQMIEKAIQHQEAMGKTNLKASEAYLAKIAKEPGVKMLEKGLYYKVIKAGNGPKPAATDTVTVNYSGSLPDGTVFDSSYKRGHPATFQLDQVIPGWTKALQNMPEGSTWMIYLAPDLAYGKFAPPAIGPNQALTFKVDLISIKQPAVSAKPATSTGK